MQHESDEVLLERQSGIAVLSLNRPERRNALSPKMCSQLHDCLREIEISDDRVVVLRGAGKDFCVGADLDADPTPSAGSPSNGRPSKAYDIPRLLHAMPQVTIAAIDGGCAGGGMGWAAACDFRFASTRARFSTAFLKVGASGDMGLAWSLIRLVGGAKAREMMFFPEKLSADGALAIGFVSRLFDPPALMEKTLDAAHRLATSPAAALQMMKSNFLSAETLSLDGYLVVETARHLQLSAGPEFQTHFASAKSSSRMDNR